MEYIRIPFADSGDKIDVPVEQQTDNSVSFTQGYPLAYSLDPETDPSARRIEREGMNGIFWTLSKAIQEIQQRGVASFIPAADNGGSPFTYAAGAIVFYNGQVYRSLKTNNTDAPTVASSWAPLLDTDNSAMDFLPVGVPVPWPTITPPAGWVNCMGQTFTTAQWPKLAVAYPSLKLPDLRGEFIRGWDNARGADSGRSILTLQGDAIRNITGATNSVYNSSGSAGGQSGAFTYSLSASNVLSSGSAAGVERGQYLFNAANVVPTASENRPRNVAFNYIVRGK